MRSCTVLLAAMITVCLTGCPIEPGAGDFLMSVVPLEMSDTIPGQRCVLLVTVEDEENGDAATGAVAISASAPGATVTVEPDSIIPGQVAEVTVIPEQAATTHSRQNHDGPPVIVDDEEEPVIITATVVGQRGGTEHTLTVPITVTSDEEDLVGPLAIDIRDMFIPWLAESHPELGITEQTGWTPTIITPHILVVMHYLFFSDEWEMHVYWHVTIQPHDWARIDLRKRFEETAPSLAFEVASWTSDQPQVPYAIEPLESLWR